MDWFHYSNPEEQCQQPDHLKMAFHPLPIACSGAMEGLLRPSRISKKPEHPLLSTPG